MSWNCFVGKTSRPGPAPIWTIVVAVALLVAGPVIVQAQSCSEPNDDPVAACLLAGDATVQAFVERPGDVDLYRFVVSGTSQVSLNLTDLPADCDLYLMDANGSILGQSVHEGAAPEQLILTVQPGTYFAVVQSDPSRDVEPARPYTLSLVISRPGGGGTVPLAGSSLRSVLLADDFNSPTNGLFPTISAIPDALELGYVDGEYSMRNIGPADFFQGVVMPGRHRDTTLVVDARLIGPMPGQAIVIVCRLQTPVMDPRSPSVYRVQVYPATREFMLLRLGGGISTQIVPRQVSPAIRRDDQWNRLELSCIGDRISARANDAELGSARDSTYQEGVLRVNVGGPASAMPRAEARLDNLVVFGP